MKTIKDVAIKKALNAHCDECALLKRCFPELTKACADSFVKGFLSGYKYKKEQKK